MKTLLAVLLLSCPLAASAVPEAPAAAAATQLSSEEAAKLAALQNDPVKVKRFHATRAYVKSMLAGRLIERPADFDSAYILTRTESVSLLKAEVERDLRSLLG